MKTVLAISMLLSVVAQDKRPGAAKTEPVLVDRIVGVINDDVILLSELREAAAAYLTSDADAKRREAVCKSTIDNLIADKLMSQQIEESRITISPEDVDRAIEDILKRNDLSKEDLIAAVEGRGMTMAKYRGDLESQLIRLKLVDLKVRSRVVVPEADIKEAYQRQITSDAREELLSLRHLFFRWGESPDPTERARVLERAKAARARILAGGDFATIAKEISEGPTAAKGGELGELGRRSLLPELARAAQSLKVMEVSEPIDTSNGVHVIRIDAIRKTEPPTYESLKNSLYQALYQKEVERQMGVWLEELKIQSAIELRLTDAC